MGKRGGREVDLKELASPLRRFAFFNPPYLSIGNSKTIKKKEGGKGEVFFKGGGEREGL